MNEKVKQTIDAVLERFKFGDIPEVVSYAMFPIPDIPSSRWSLLNRTIMFISGTRDARGYLECVFFHELAHVAHEKVIGSLKPGQDVNKEVGAHLTI
jgi:hypothetical protein